MGLVDFEKIKNPEWGECDDEGDKIQPRKTR